MSSAAAAECGSGTISGWMLPVKPTYAPDANFAPRSIVLVKIGDAGLVALFFATYTERSVAAAS